jgi:hypothetical protein
MFYVVLVAALLLLPPLSAVARAPAGSRSSCSTHCGKISIPYPFGVEYGCYHDGGFNLTCDHSYSPPQLYLGDGTVQVLDIDLPNGTVRVNSSTFPLYSNYIAPLDTSDGNGTWRAGGPGYAADRPYFLAEGRNNLLALGCNDQVVLLGENGTLVSSCSPFCLHGDSIQSFGICSGIFCCQAIILEGLPSYTLQLQGAGSIDQVLIAESDYLFNSAEYYGDGDGHGQTVPAMLAWTIDTSVWHTNGTSPSCRSKQSFCHNYTALSELNIAGYYGPGFDDNVPVDHGHNCLCSGRYQGNPYISHGCYGNNTLPKVFIFILISRHINAAMP